MIFGGHIFVAAGVLRLVDCIIIDLTYFIPLTQVSFGGDILVGLT